MRACLLPFRAVDAAAHRELTVRQHEVLAALCRAYLRERAPVASARLVRAQGLPWSGATVRAELHALAERGLVWSEHASAGRVPTDAGLQVFVDTVAFPRSPRPELAAAVDSAREVAAPGRIPALLTLLSAALECAALLVVRRRDRAVVREVELVPLVEGRALVVLQMSEGPARVAPVHVPGGARGRGGLEALRAGLRWIFVGRTLEGARARVRELGQELEVGVPPRPPMGGRLRPALEVGLSVCRAHGARDDGPRLEVAGRGHLVRRLREQGDKPLLPALDLLEDPPAVAEIVAGLVPDRHPARPRRARVRVGPPPLSGVSFVACPLPGPGAAAGTSPDAPVTAPPPPPASTSRTSGETAQGRPVLALLGPGAMDFATVIPLVEYAARTCSGMEA